MNYKHFFPYALNDRVGNEFKTDYMHVNVDAKFSSLPRKQSRANSSKNNKGILLLLSQKLFK